MKRYLMILFAIISMASSAKALDYETARQQAYYLTDKMAYELNLSDAQYNDAYEINLDYLLSLNSPRDIELDYLRHRNQDLRYILMDWQWSTFVAADYFFNPVRWLSGAWFFPIYRHYTSAHFFYARPSIFFDYRGAHGRAFHPGRSFYADRHHRWNGGMRGADHNMVGRPREGRDGFYDRNGRFGRNNHGNNQNAGFGRNDRGRNNPGNSNFGNTDRGNNNRGTTTDRTNRGGHSNNNQRPNVGNNTNRGTTTQQPFGGGTMRSSSRTTVNTSRSQSTPTHSTRSQSTRSGHSGGTATRSAGNSSSRGNAGGGGTRGGGRR